MALGNETKASIQKNAAREQEAEQRLRRIREGIEAASRAETEENLRIQQAELKRLDAVSKRGITAPARR